MSDTITSGQASGLVRRVENKFESFKLTFDDLAEWLQCDPLQLKTELREHFATFTEEQMISFQESIQADELKRVVEEMKKLKCAQPPEGEAPVVDMLRRYCAGHRDLAANHQLRNELFALPLMKRKEDEEGKEEGATSSTPEFITVTGSGTAFEAAIQSRIEKVLGKEQTKLDKKKNVSEKAEKALARKRHWAHHFTLVAANAVNTKCDEIIARREKEQKAA